MIEVSCALIIDQNRVLLTQKPELSRFPNQWEFPGGKIELGESPRNGLIREIQEELNCIITPMPHPLCETEFCYPDQTVRLFAFIASLKQGEITLQEHQSMEWVEIPEILKKDLVPADIQIAKELISHSVRLSH